MTVCSSLVSSEISDLQNFSLHAMDSKLMHRVISYIPNTLRKLMIRA